MRLDHAYVWNKVRVGRGASISQSVVCDNVEVKAGVTLARRCVLAYNVSDPARGGGEARRGPQVTLDPAPTGGGRPKHDPAGGDGHFHAPP